MIDAQLEIFNEHRALMFGIAWRMLGNAADAEDILQEALDANGIERSPAAGCIT